MLGCMFAWGIFATTSVFAGSEISVIINKSNKVGALNRSRLVDIFTLNSSQWEGGARIQIFDFKGSPAIRQHFYDYLNLSPDLLKRIWLRKQFSGRAVPPTTFASEDDVVRAVASTPGAIGYVSSGKVGDGVAIIATVP